MVAPTSLSPNFCELPVHVQVGVRSYQRKTLEINQMQTMQSKPDNDLWRQSYLLRGPLLL